MAAAGLAQPISFFPPALQSYLSLSDAQTSQILQINQAYTDFGSSRYSRIYQVQAEIAAETAKSPLDPYAIGIRYAEIETIRREMNTELIAVRARIRAVLTDPQIAKVKALEDAAKLYPTYSAAQCLNIAEPQSVAHWFNTDQFVSTPVPASIVGALVPSCVVPIATIYPSKTAAPVH